MSGFFSVVPIIYFGDINIPGKSYFLVIPNKRIGGKAIMLMIERV